MDEAPSREEIEHTARDWFVRIQLGDATGPGETAEKRMEALAAFEAWRKADPAHAVAYDALIDSFRQTDGLESRYFVAQSRLPRAGFHQRHPWLSGAIAASLVATIGFSVNRAGYLAPTVGGTLATRSPSKDLGALAVTLVGESRRIDLPDGSWVLLDADSELRIRYSAGERRMRLDRGRARFNVAHEPGRPFIVDAGDNMVIAHGTIFDVAVGPRGAHVALLRGEIEVRRAHGAGVPSTTSEPGAARYLKPGEGLGLVPNAAMPEPQAVSANSFDWVSGRLAFADTPLVDAVEEMNHYNARKIVLDHGVDGDLRISGGFDARAPQAFAGSVAQALHLLVKKLPDGRILLQSASQQGKN
jgi:transmembrane sensor